MNKLIRMTFAIVTLSIMTVSCDFRPLVEPGNTHYVRVYLDEHILNTTEGFYNPEHVKPTYKRPEIMRVTLGDKSTGRVVAERYLRNHGNDARGHYYDGYIICDPGEWSLLAWNFDTEATQVSDPTDQHLSKAYTNRIASHLMAGISSRLDKTKTDRTSSPEKIVYEPDHLFVASDPEVSIPYSADIDTLRTPGGDYFTASTIVEAWYIQVNVKGLEYVSSALGLVTGLAGSKTLSDAGLDCDDPVTDYFEMTARKASEGSDTGVIYATFNTFGKIPDTSSGLEVTFDFQTNYGKALSARIDITEEFRKENAVKHRWIILDKTIEIPKGESGGGGFSPGVNDWNDINTDLII